MNTPAFQPIGQPEERYRGRLLRVATQRMVMPDGRQKDFEYAERAPGVRVLVTDGSRILLSREWRSELGAWDYRLPGGKVFDSLDEYLVHTELCTQEMADVARAAARKELHEETSLLLPLKSFNLFHRSVCGATVVWDLYYYQVTVDPADVTKLEAIVTDEGEQTMPEWCDKATVLRLCLQRGVSEDRTAAALMTHLLGDGNDSCPTGGRHREL